MTRFAIAFAALLAIVAPASAQVGCSQAGMPPSFDPTARDRVLAWVGNIEVQFQLTRTRQPNIETVKSLRLFTGDWAFEPPKGSVEWMFRQAVAHGINTQYFVLMAQQDQADAKNHNLFANLEAARALACLGLMRVPSP